MKNRFKVVDEMSCEETYYDSIEKAYSYASNIEGVIFNLENDKSYSCEYIHSLAEAEKELE